MQRNQNIDLLKFIFSLCIIAIHVSLFKNVNTTLYHITTMGLMRIAVPFFFIVSGYYYYQKIKLNKDTKSYIYHIIKLFLIFESIEVMIYTIPLLSTIKQYGILPYIWKIFSVGLGGAYWYLISLILSLCILTPLWKKQNIFLMFIIGLVLYLTVFTNDSYSSFFEQTTIQNIAMIHTKIWTWPQAGLCSSLFYLSLGALISQYQLQIKGLHIFLVGSIFLLLLESSYLQSHGAKDANCYISLIFIVPLLFLYVQKHSYVFFDTYLLGKMSLYIYMIHQPLLNILRSLFPIFSYNNELLYCVTVVLTIGISYIIVKIKNPQQ